MWDSESSPNIHNKGEDKLNNLVIKEKVKVAGVEVPSINGGFGEGKKSMLSKHIAEIHEKKLFKVNEVINNNRSRFKDNIDIIDVKNNGEFVILLTDNNVMSKMQTSKADNIYLLSERGYAKLIKIFDDDKSWELYDVMLDEYFDLRDGTEIKQPMTQLELAQYSINLLVEQERQLKLVNENVNKLEDKINNNVVKDGYRTGSSVARSLNLFSNNDKPHVLFIDTVAKHLGIYNSKLGYTDDYIQVVQDVMRGGNSGTVVYYSEEGVSAIEEYLDEHFKLETTEFKRGENKGKINKIKFSVMNKTFEFNLKTYTYYGVE